MVGFVFKKYDVIKVYREITVIGQDGLKYEVHEGSVGTVVHVYSKDSYKLEFTNSSSKESLVTTFSNTFGQIGHLPDPTHCSFEVVKLCSKCGGQDWMENNGANPYGDSFTCRKCGKNRSWYE